MAERITPEQLEIGDNLKVVYPGGEIKYFTITSTDDIFYRDEHDELAPGSTESYAEVSALNPPTGQLYWIGRIEFDANVKLYIKQPAATNRFGTNRSPEGGMLTDSAFQILEGRKVNLWIAEDYPPNVQIKNDSGATIKPVIWWIGKRFAVVEIKMPSVYKTVRIGGISD